MKRLRKFCKVLVLALMVPILPVFGKDVGYGVPILEPTDVIHIKKSDYDEIKDLRAAEDFRQAILGAGFSIVENPPHFEDNRVEVRRHEDWGQNGSGPSLVTALNNFNLNHREEWQRVMSAQLQEWWLHRFQTECPHDVGTYTGDNPLVRRCRACHKPLD